MSRKLRLTCPLFAPACEGPRRSHEELLIRSTDKSISIMDMEDVQTEIINDLKDLDDVLARSDFLIMCGASYKGIPEDERLECDLIKDCQTMTWVHTGLQDGIFTIAADSHSMLIKGALFLITEIYDRRPMQLVRSFECSLIHLSEFKELFTADQLRTMRHIVESISVTAG